MGVDIRNILSKVEIDFRTSGKNISEGWVGVNCPFCGDTGYHGGFNIHSGLWYNCWKCGNHKAKEALSLLAGLPFSEIEKRIIGSTSLLQREDPKKRAGALPFELPIGCQKMTKRHKDYLIGRGYNPDSLERQFRLLGTNHLGAYQHRIVAPIFLNGKMVSYQTRDISGTSLARYKACSREREIICHKNTLYNLDRAKKRTIMVFEGITSVWRWGDNTVATFGIQWAKTQAIRLLKYKTAIIFFDKDDNARRQSEKLANFLASFGVETLEMDANDVEDPAEMTEKDVKYYKKYFKI